VIARISAAALASRTSPAGRSASAFTTDALLSASLRHEALRKSFVVAGVSAVPGEKRDEGGAELSLRDRDVPVPALPDSTWARALRRDVHDDRQREALARDTRESLEVLDAVLDHRDAGCGSQQAREPARRPRRIVGLRRGGGPVHRLRELRIGQNGGPDGERLVPRYLDHQLLERRARADDDLVARHLRKPGGDRSADGAGTDDRDACRHDRPEPSSPLKNSRRPTCPRRAVLRCSSVTGKSPLPPRRLARHGAACVGLGPFFNRLLADEEIFRTRSEILPEAPAWAARGTKETRLKALS
jgi:hypothetical protein